MEKAANANRNIFLLIPVEFPAFSEIVWVVASKLPRNTMVVSNMLRTRYLRGKHVSVKKDHPLI